MKTKVLVARIEKTDGNLYDTFAEKYYKEDCSVKAVDENSNSLEKNNMRPYLFVLDGGRTTLPTFQIDKDNTIPDLRKAINLSIPVIYSAEFCERFGENINKPLYDIYFYNDKKGYETVVENLKDSDYKLTETIDDIKGENGEIIMQFHSALLEYNDTFNASLWLVYYSIAGSNY